MLRGTVRWFMDCILLLAGLLAAMAAGARACERCLPRAGRGTAWARISIMALAIICIVANGYAQITYSEPAVLNTDATTDENSDEAVTIQTDRAGTWLAVWVRIQGTNHCCPNVFGTECIKH